MVQTVATTTAVVVTVSVAVDPMGGAVDPGELEPSHFPKSAWHPAKQ